LIGIDDRRGDELGPFSIDDVQDVQRR
jgi:hypothetical protein